MHEIYTRIFGSSFKLIPNQKRLVRFYNVEQTPLPIKNDFFSPRFFFLRVKHQTIVFCKKTHSFWSSIASRALCRKKTRIQGVATLYYISNIQVTKKYSAVMYYKLL